MRRSAWDARPGIEMFRCTKFMLFNYANYFYDLFTFISI